MIILSYYHLIKQMQSTRKLTLELYGEDWIVATETMLIQRAKNLYWKLSEVEKLWKEDIIDRLDLKWEFTYILRFK